MLIELDPHVKIAKLIDYYKFQGHESELNLTPQPKTCTLGQSLSENSQK